MARRKRASMREGPLADLFRSTTDDTPLDPPEAPSPDAPGPAGPVPDERARARRSADETPGTPGREAEDVGCVA